MKRLLLTGVLAAAALCAGRRVETCCMVPVTYEGTIGQDAQEAILFHNDGREELILRIHYRITGKTPPPFFAWVITVPNEPDSYEVADAKIFEETFDWAQSLIEPPSKSRGESDSKDDNSAGLEFGKPVKVGPFDIQPVRALGKEALAGLNGWLEKNGFPTEDPKHMEYFVENKFTFLAVKVKPAEGDKSVEAGGGLPPLHLGFRSESPYYPLRFSSRQGVFDVNLTVFTKKDFDYNASGDSLKKINWADGGLVKNVAVKPESFPPTLKAAYGKTAFKGDTGEWKLNVLRTFHVNEGNTIMTWKEDVFFRTKG